MIVFTDEQPPQLGVSRRVTPESAVRLGFSVWRYYKPTEESKVEKFGILEGKRKLIAIADSMDEVEAFMTGIEFQLVRTSEVIKKLA